MSATMQREAKQLEEEFILNVSILDHDVTTCVQCLAV